jgi:tape measure domain-containing protein
MSGFTYSINFQALGVGNLSRAQSAVDRLDNSVEDVNTSVSRLGKNLRQTGGQGESSFAALDRRATNLIATLGVAAAVSKGVDDAMRMESAAAGIAFATGGATQGAAAMQFLSDTADRLGTSFFGSVDAYKLLAASVQGTPLAGSINDIFTAVSEGSAVMRLSEHDMNGVMLAISQMASKGKISSEELRQQLAERLPGAFGIASRAMGMNQQDFNKLLESGQIYAEDFLPKFAAEMRRTYASGIPDAVNSSTANFNRFRKELTETSVVFGQQILPYATQFLREYAIPAVKWIGDNIRVLTILGATMGGVALAAKAVTIATQIYSGALAVARGAQIALNWAMRANPIGIVITLLGVLAAGVYLAAKRWDTFRAKLLGNWALMKEFGKMVLERVVKPFKIMGNLIAGVFTLDKSRVLQAVEDAGNYLMPSTKRAGQRLAGAYVKGYNQGLNKPKAAQKGGGLAKPSGGNAVTDAFGAPPAPGKPTGEDSKIKSGLQGIADGGKQVKNVTVNVNKLVEQLIVKTERLDQNISEIRDAVQREFLQVLNTANQIQ